MFMADFWRTNWRGTVLFKGLQITCAQYHV